MELMINFIIGAISFILTGLLSSFIYDKIKNHLSIGRRKSGFEFEVKFKFYKK